MINIRYRVEWLTPDGKQRYKVYDDKDLATKAERWCISQGLEKVFVVAILDEIQPETVDFP